MASRDYLVRMPRDTTVVAACQDVKCDSWQHGWETTIDESTPLGTFQAAYIRQTAGRTFRELRREDGVTVFRFDPYQRCFEEHRTRPARLLVRDGGQLREHVSFSDIAEDYTEHVGRVAELQQKG